MSEDADERLPLSYCTACDHELDGATYAGQGGRVPTEGDYTVCIYCGNAMVYRADQTLRAVTLSEWVHLKAHERAAIERAQAVVARLDRTKKTTPRAKN
jgi:hypothetical protein